MDIQELMNVTGLKEPFIRKCFREMGDILSPYTKRGKNNRLLFDSNALKIFDQIKQSKENGLALSSIKETLTKSLNKVVEQGTNESERGEQGRSNYGSNNMPESPKHFTDASREIVELKDHLYQSEIDKMNALHRIEMIESNIKLLPAGGDPHEMRRIFSRMFEIVIQLEIQTRPWFGHSSVNQGLWSELRQILKGDHETRH